MEGTAQAKNSARKWKERGTVAMEWDDWSKRCGIRALGRGWRIDVHSQGLRGLSATC